MGQLLPVIKNYAWFRDDALILKEPLLDFDQSPVMGIGEDLDNMIKYSEASSADNFAAELAERKIEALRNLKNLDITYEVQDVNGSRVIVASGQEFASEKILDKDFLKKIHEELESDQIAIGIPFQGLFVAISNKDTDLLNKFPAVIKKHYDNSQADKISDKVFLSVNAIIVAHAGLEEDSQNAASVEPCFVQTMTLTGETEKDSEFVVFIGHKDLEVMKATMEKTYQDLLLKCKEEEAISCNIKFMIIPDIIEKTEGLVNLCNGLIITFCDPTYLSENYPFLKIFKIIFMYDQEVIAESEVKNDK